MKVTVLSTAYRSSNEHICRASVRTQEGVTVLHHYLDAANQDISRTKLENLMHMAESVEPEGIIAFVDGDDWLAHRGALERAASEHAKGAWVTYGSFVQADGKPGFAAPYETPEYRREPWKATHLKTVRAGLLHRIRPEDLMYRGAWIDRGDDPTFMFPCLEMAGRDRVRFIEDTLYVYSHADSWELTVTPEERQHELDIVNEVRKRRPYARLESL